MPVEHAQEAGPPAVVQYPIPLGRYRAHEPFDADAEASQILSVLAPLLGNRVDVWTVEPEARHLGEVEARLAHLAAQPGSSTALVWVGHGRSNDQDAALIVPGVPSSPADGELLPAQLGTLLVAQSRRREHLEPHPWTLVLVEACGAGRFVELVNAHLQTVGGVSGVALIGIGDPSGHGHTATAGRILSQVVAAFDANNTRIRLSDLLIEVDERLGKGLWGVVASSRTAGYAIERPSLVFSATLDVYTELRRLLPEQPADVQSHFARKGMGSDFGELAWSFVGRSAERTRILDHLRRGRGLLAVTGPAGSGKSAVLGNVLLRSQPELRNVLVAAGFLEEDPPTPEETTDDVDAWIHLSGLTHREFLDELGAASQRNLAPTFTEVQFVEALVAALQHRASPLRVVADALDESRDPDAIAQTLKQLAGAGACLVVGTRASVLEGPDHAAPDAHDLLDRLGVSDGATMWVRRDPKALRTYLERSFARELPTLAPALQARILTATCDTRATQRDAEGRGFLYARLLVSELKMSSDLDERTLDTLLAGNHRTIFAAAVERLGEQDPAVADLLEALAHAQGNGIPRAGTVWATVAKQLSGREVSPQHIDKALELGAPYIAIGAEHGQAVYRLAHRTFQEHYEGPTRAETALRIADSLIELAEHSCIDPHPYLVAYLAGHVGRAGKSGWELLAQHESLLDVIDPTSVARELMRTSFGQMEIPPALSGVLAAADVLSVSAPEDRPGVRQLSTASFTSSRPTAEDSDVWSVSTAVRRRLTPHLALIGRTDWVNAVAAFTSTEGRVLLAIASLDGKVRMWDPTVGRQVGAPLQGHTDLVWAMTAFTSTEGRVLLATASVLDGTVRMWDPAIGRQVGALRQGNGGGSRAITAFTSHGQVLLATGSDDGAVRVWDPPSGHRIGDPLRGHTDAVSAITAFTGTSGQALLATAGRDGTVRVWDPTIGRQVGAPLQGHTGWVWSVTAFTSTGGGVLLATGGGDGTVRVWDPTIGRQVGAPLQGHTDWVRAVTGFTSTDGQVRLATASEDGTVRMWDPASGAQVGEPLEGHTDSVNAVTSFTTGGRVLLATGGGDGAVRVWDPASGRQVDYPPQEHTGGVRAVTVFTSADGQLRLATASKDGTMRLWDPASGAQVGAPLGGHTKDVMGVTAFTSNGRVLLATFREFDRTVRVWDPATGQQVGAPLRDPSAPVTAVTALTGADGRVLLAIGRIDGAMRLWDHTSGQQVGPPLQGHTGSVSAITSFTGTNGEVLLATASKDGTVRMWDPARGAQVGEPLRGHTDGVRAVTAFTSPDKRVLLAAGSFDGSVRVWDPATGRQVRTLRLHTSITAMASLPSGDLVVALTDGWARIHLRR